MPLNHVCSCCTRSPLSLNRLLTQGLPISTPALNHPVKSKERLPVFFNFVDELRAAGIPASFKEHLVLLEALEKDVIEQAPEAF